MQTCRWCGARIAEDTTVCPRCGVRLRRQSHPCPHCKREIRVGLAVCPHCGEELGRRRIPWKLIASLGGIALAALVIYAIVSFAPFPISVPLVAAPPSPTPTAVILPPTATPTETPRPPTPTRTATSTPVITVTATITTPVLPLESPSPTATATVTPTETPAYRYGAPRLLAPVDGHEFSGSGEIIHLEWEPVPDLGEDEWYEIRVGYVNKNDATVDNVVAWVRNDGIPWTVGTSFYEDLSLSEREIEWDITIVWDPEADGQGQPVSAPSETWTFRWQ